MRDINARTLVAAAPSTSRLIRASLIIGIVAVIVFLV